MAAFIYIYTIYFLLGYEALGCVFLSFPVFGLHELFFFLHVLDLNWLYELLFCFFLKAFTRADWGSTLLCDPGFWIYYLYET